MDSEKTHTSQIVCSESFQTIRVRVSGSSNILVKTIVRAKVEAD